MMMSFCTALAVPKLVQAVDTTGSLSETIKCDPVIDAAKIKAGKCIPRGENDPQDIKDKAKSSCKDSGEPSKLCDIFDKYINPLLQFLTVGFGVIVTIMIVIGGIQYSASGGDPQGVAEAKKKISNAVVALIAYGLLFSLLQFLVPGGVF